LFALIGKARLYKSRTKTPHQETRHEFIQYEWKSQKENKKLIPKFIFRGEKSKESSFFSKSGKVKKLSDVFLIPLRE